MNLDDDSLYELLPAYHRERDAALGFPLRALFRVLSRDGAQAVEADIDAWQDALFVETCAETLLPRLAALVGAEPLRPLPRGAEVSMRAFIGNVIRYRRAKGTPLTLELLARDVTAFNAKAVEFYARLATTLTVRAPRTERAATALIRDPEVRALHGTAFDRNARVPDVRSIARARGRYNLPNVGVFVWRRDCQPYDAPEHDDGALDFTAAELEAVPPALPWGVHAGHFALVPPSRTVPLFAPPRATEGVSPSVCDVPDRLRRLPLWRELEARRSARAKGVAGPVDGWFTGREAVVVYVQRGAGQPFRRLPAEELMIGALEPDGGPPAVPPWTRPDPTKDYRDAANAVVPLPVTAVLDPTNGRLVIAKPAAQADVTAVRLSYATGRPGEIGGGAYERGAPQEVPPGAQVYLVGLGPLGSATRATSLADALAQWTAANLPGTAYVVIADNSGDPPDAVQPSLDLIVPRGRRLVIVAAEWRPSANAALGSPGRLVRRSRSALLQRPIAVKAAPAVPNVPAGELELDGVRLDAGLDVAADALSALTLRHATIAPFDAPSVSLAGDAERPLDVTLERCLCGAILGGARVDRIRVAESVVTRAIVVASIGAANADVILERVTVFGAVDAKTLEASDSILLGPVDVARRQVGCVRYSYVDPDNALPRRFRCQPDLAREARAATLGRALTGDELEAERLRTRPVFIDDAPDEPAFAMLRIDAPREIALGGEHDTEMGAYGFAAHALRIANLTDLFVDYLPLGLEAATLGADRANSDALRSQMP